LRLEPALRVRRARKAMDGKVRVLGQRERRCDPTPPAAVRADREPHQRIAREELVTDRFAVAGVRPELGAVADPRELPAALRRAIDSGGPAVVHVDVDPVKHMWAPGLVQFKDMHQEPKGR